MPRRGLNSRAQTNLLISTARGYQASLLLISRGESARTQPNVDFMMRYRPAGRFVIEPSAPSVSIAQTVALPPLSQPAELPSNSTGASRPTIERVSFSPARIDTPADTGAPAGGRPATQNADEIGRSTRLN